MEQVEYVEQVDQMDWVEQVEFVDQMDRWGQSKYAGKVKEFKMMGWVKLPQRE